MLIMDTETKIFKILKQPNCNYLSQVSFTLIIFVFGPTNLILIEALDALLVVMCN